MNHAKAKRIAKKWARNKPPQSNARLLAQTYLEVRRLAEEIASRLDFLNLPEDSGCLCDDCVAGRKLFELREALKT